MSAAQLSMFPSAPVDDDTASLLALIAGDPIHEADRARVVQAIRDTARDHGGQVDPNVVRRRLTCAHGLTVYPRVIGAVYNALARSGRLVVDGWIVSSDVAGKNAGKPCRRYRLVQP